MSLRCPVPLLGVCAYSGTGKTTLLGRLIPLLRQAEGFGWPCSSTPTTASTSINRARTATSCVRPVPTRC